MTLLLMLCHCELQMSYIIRSQPTEKSLGEYLLLPRILGQHSKVFIYRCAYLTSVKSILMLMFTLPCLLSKVTVASLNSGLISS